MRCLLYTSLPEQFKPAELDVRSDRFPDRDGGVHVIISLGNTFQQYWANMNKTREWIDSLDFIVHIGMYYEDTVKYADIVLPVCSKFEDTVEHSIVRSDYNHVNLQTKCIDPLFESKPDFDVMRLIAEEMGVAEYLPLSLIHICKVVGGLMPMLGETGAPRVVGLPDVPASQPESDRDQTLTLSDVQALAVGCEAACAHAHGGCDGSHEHAAAQPQLATEPLEVSAAVEADPLFGAEQRTLPQDQWHAVLERLVGMMQQVADALGDMSAYASDHSQLRQIATDALGQFAGANARYRYAKAVQAGQRADGVVAVASMYENADIMLRLKSVPCQAPLLHLAFDGALDQSVEERLRSFLYYV